MELYPPFPTCREDTPKRQAEKQIYEAFQACDFDGRVLYEVRPLPTAPQLDFAVWIVGLRVRAATVRHASREDRAPEGRWNSGQGVAGTEVAWIAGKPFLVAEIGVKAWVLIRKHHQPVHSRAGRWAAGCWRCLRRGRPQPEGTVEVWRGAGAAGFGWRSIFHLPR